jgi:hypothetical protein
MSEAELRVMVREVLHEALGRRGQPKALAEPKTETVRIAGDADLAAFVQRLVKLLDDPASAGGVRSGRHRFTLGAVAPVRPAPEKTAAGSSAAQPAGQSTVLVGTVTETKINKCAGAGVVVLAADAVITPLARDRARALGLKIERKR